ncbi:MAG: response regulator [Geopsychrobacter sp.]|nr:response regulator [Geopsychrobacter sp.]
MSPSRSELIQICYEIALAINETEDMPRLLSQALTMLVRKLNCSAGGIHLLDIEPDSPPGFKPPVTIPRCSERIPSYVEALAQLPIVPTRDALSFFADKLPLCGVCQNGDNYYFFDLLPHGFLLLLKSESTLDPIVVKELRPLAAKLGQAIGTCLQRKALRESVDHFSMVSEELRHYQESLEEMVEDRTVTLKQEMAERRIAEEELRQSEEQHRLFLQQLPDPVVVFNRQCIPQYINKAFTDSFGWCLDDFSAKSFPLLHEESGSKGDWLRQQIGKGESPSGIEVNLQNSSHQVLRVAVSGIMTRQRRRDDDLQVLVLRDVTEQHRLEAQLRHSQKMQAIGTLTGGIAHDFNNLLQAISGYTQLLQRRINRKSREGSFLDSIAVSTERAVDLVKQLLIASRRGESRLVPIDLNETVEQAVKLLERTLVKMVRIETGLQETPLIVDGDAGQLEQVILNLSNNAQAAMPNGGGLTLLTKEVMLEEDFCLGYDGLKPGAYALLSVSDNGIGMSSEVIEQIFEPFFTTKRVGEGTGLGLSSAYGIVRNHQGVILCESEPGRGTLFSIYLPLSAGMVRLQPQERQEKATAGGEETLLIVDDEQAIVEIARSILEAGGYRVIRAANGEEALEIYLRRKSEISLVILDLGMPGMGGEKCLKALRAANPKVRVLVASGYASKEQAQRVLDLGAAAFVGKPYRVETILKEVRLALDD